MANLINGLGGSAGFGENYLSGNDDGYISGIDITPVFGSQGLNFFGTNYTTLSINNNGNVTFGSNGLNAYTPFGLQISQYPMIAAFFADVDTRRGSVTPTPDGTSTGSNLVWYDFDTTAHRLTITWDDVGYYYQSDKFNAFQMRLTGTGNGNFTIEFRYESINWTTGSTGDDGLGSGGINGLGGQVAHAGYSSGNGISWLELPASGNQDAMLALSATLGNTGLAGIYSYSVRSSETKVNILGTANADILNGNDLDNVITGLAGNDILTGEAGADTLKGGKDDDTYYVDALDVILELADSGKDTVVTEFSYKLVAQVENLILTGVENINGLGNSANNVIVGNDANNMLVGFGGNDSLKGGVGNDNLQGGDGIDIAVYSGISSDYKIETLKTGLKITDLNLDNGNDGVDTLTGIEKLQFSQASLLPSQTLFHNYAGAENSQLYGEYYGYYKFFFDLSSNSYVHIDNSLPGLDNLKTAEMAKLSQFQANANTNGFALLSATELGLPGETALTGTSTALTALGLDTDQYHYLFKDGFYDAYIDTTNADLKVDVSSVALVGRTEDSLFISFRGSDVFGDWMDDFFAMEEHYARYEPLLDAIDSYIAANNITKVYVSGHSLGGQMASMYMADANHQKFGVEYNAVTFEAANKHVPVVDVFNYQQDNRLINFEMYSDPVPDLWFDNYGKSIFISNGDADLTPALGLTHGMGAMKKAFDLAITQVSDALPSSEHTRVYVDTNGDGKIATDYSTPVLAPVLTSGLGGITTATGLLLSVSPTTTIAAADLALLSGTSPDVSVATAFAGVELTAAGLGVMTVSALSALADEVEYLWTGYDIKTASGKLNATLTVNPLYFYVGNQDTVHVDNANLGFVDLSNTLPYTGFLAPSINIDASTWDKAHNYFLKLSGNGASNTITGSAFSDMIRGEAGDDVIYGGDGNDVIDRPVNDIISEWASGGNDRLYGGKGNDTYFINSNADMVVEKASEGAFDAVVITGNRGLSEYFNSQDYTIPQNVEIAIARDDRTFNPSENFNITASGTNKHYLIGNAGNNKIVGGDATDVLVGGGDVDLLIGGKGNDILFGGVYAYGKSALGNLPAEVSKLVTEQADARPVDSVDVGYYFGGVGADTMIGELSESAYNTTESNFSTDADGDNDYFFIDVNLANNNTGNADSIKNFYVASTDLTADDWLVFSAQQLGLSETYMENTLGWDKGTLDVFGKTANSYNLDFNAGGTFASEHLFKVNGIANYSAESLFVDNDPSFILDYSTGNFYFDQDGDRDVGDQLLVANVARHPSGDDLASFHANQILVVSSFDLWT